MGSALSITTSNSDLAFVDSMNKEILRSTSKMEFCCVKLTSLMHTTGKDTFCLHRKAGDF
jgi:hypothetical protein